MEKCTIRILGQAGEKWFVQEPAVLEGIQWKTKRRGEAASLTFTCVKDELLSFQEGSEVTFRYGDKDVFSGYIFEKHRNKDQLIEVTCYDRTRYLRNKENYLFSNVRADQVLTRIAQDFDLQLGEVENTQYVIPKFSRSNSTLWDTIEEALGITKEVTGVMYTMYDDFGKICLKSVHNMDSKCLIDSDTAEDFDYTTSIDKNTANYIVVKVKDSNTPIVEKSEGENGTIKKWGLLQYDCESTTVEYAKQKAKALLKMRNKVTKSLGINGALGDINVRAGCGIYISLNLGDSKPENKRMVVIEANHTFENGHHSMDLTLIDGEEFYNE